LKNEEKGKIAFCLFRALLSQDDLCRASHCMRAGRRSFAGIASAVRRFESRRFELSTTVMPTPRYTITRTTPPRQLAARYGRC
jgi:hypothetical protein